MGRETSYVSQTVQKMPASAMKGGVYVFSPQDDCFDKHYSIETNNKPDLTNLDLKRPDVTQGGLKSGRSKGVASKYSKYDAHIEETLFGMLHKRYNGNFFLIPDNSSVLFYVTWSPCRMCTIDDGLITAIAKALWIRAGDLRLKFRFDKFYTLAEREKEHIESGQKSNFNGKGPTYWKNEEDAIEEYEKLGKLFGNHHGKPRLSFGVVGADKRFPPNKAKPTAGPQWVIKDTNKKT